VKNKQFFWKDSQTDTFLSEALLRNELIVSTTDTVCGLLANTSLEGFNALHTVKGDRGDKPYLVIVSGLEKLNAFVNMKDLPQGVKQVARHFWPGPMTIILKARQDLPSYLVSKEGTIAVRIPRHEGLLNLLQYFDGLFSTSANKSGQEVPASLGILDKEIAEVVAYIIQDPNPNEEKVPSTLVDFSKDGEWRVLREGAIKTREIEKYYEQ
jgi:L-threonylcarbamoyladenylate synthase